jgi:hypothetical protein
MRLAFTWTLLIACLAAAAPSPAEAQFRRMTDPATGERYNVEVSYGLWNPTPEFEISSESLGIPGTLIDLVEDFGFEKKRLSDFRVVLRPAKKHKFRLGYVPIKYDVEGHILRQDIVFNGQLFRLGLPINAAADWKAWRFGYEYDFLYRDRGFIGVILEAKYTDINVDLDAPALPEPEFARAKAPIPAVGVIGRGYLAKNLSVTGEFTMFRLPNGEDDEYQGSYYDFDIYGTLNFTNNVGAQFGYRSLDVSYTVKEDFGDLNLKGYYFSGVVRF